MTGLIQDLRYAGRAFRRRPGFTALAVAILALGTGANTAIFSVAKSVLVDPLPYPESSRLVWMTETRPDGSEISVSYPNYVDWRDRNRSFESLAAFTGSSATLPGDPPERLNAHVVSGNFFATLRVPARLGRTIVPSDDLPGAPPVAYLSHALWTRRFGSDPGIVGRPVSIGGAIRTVVGVAPPGLRSYDYGTADVWIPLGPWARDPDSDTLMRKSHAGLYAIGRLRKGASLATARADMDRVRRNLAETYPAENGKHGIAVRSLRDEVVGDVRPALLIVSVAASLLLLIACANVSNLLLARWAERRREIAIRVAIGADRRRVVRQLLTESLALAAAGSAAGLAAAFGLLKAIAVSRTIEIARLDEVRLDAPVLAVLAAATVATAILFGLAPALRSAKTPERLARRDAAGPERGRLTGALIAGEIGLSLVLLCATGLLARSFWRLLRVDPGFLPSRVLTARLDAPDGPGRDGREAAFYDAALREARRIPGVRAASAVNPLPLGGANRQDGIVVEGSPEPAAEDVPSTDVAIVDPAYFGTIGIPLLRGRGFLASDDADKPRVAVVSAAAARRFWPGRDPIGRRFTNARSRPDRPRPWFTVVGVVGDVRLAIDASPASEIYYPEAQRSMGVMTLVVRTSGAPEAAAGELAAAVHRVDPGQPLYRIASLEEIAERSLAGRRFLLTLLGSFAALGLLVSVGGLSGVVGRIVAGRTREIGIRMALGATGGNVVAGVLRRIAPPVAAGLAGGLAAALAARGVLRSVLYGVAPGDPATFVAVPLLLAAVAAAAAWLPARRAARIDPMRALREE
ncbi:MAG TPA: ABC transporter permease [Thermoanaerobaculia bacterium]|jgi:putative ABC transport system permease protein|nr:ABC transporter permease [Thermoanaerobaculia bacterium]